MTYSENLCRLTSRREQLTLFDAEEQCIYIQLLTLSDAQSSCSSRGRPFSLLVSWILFFWWWFIYHDHQRYFKNRMINLGLHFLPKIFPFFLASQLGTKGLLPLGWGKLSFPQVEKVKNIGVLFMSDGRMLRKMDRRMGIWAVVMQALLWLVTVKKEQGETKSYSPDLPLFICLDPDPWSSERKKCLLDSSSWNSLPSQGGRFTLRKIR